jgi:methionyl aminopeptidase
MITIKEPWELAVMRANGRRLAEVAAAVREKLVVGISTLELDELAEGMIRKMGALPAFKGYEVADAPPFPASICASLNEQVVHGIPNEKPLKAGDVISIDLGLSYGGYFADMAFTVALGDQVPPRVAELLDATEQSLYEGAAAARAGRRTGDIGSTIESRVSRSGLGIIRQYVGHGIGRRLHERPSVPNYGKANTGELLKPGMCLAIEPMITLGTYKTRTLKDRWTVVTTDGSIAAHFEHTVAVTDEGPEILTVLDGQHARVR